MKFMAAEVTGGVPYRPPVPGLVTVTGTVPALVMADAGIVAVTFEDPPEVVV